MAYYRRKHTEKEEAKINVGIGILGTIACVPLSVILVGAAIGVLNADKGTFIERLLGCIGFGFFFAGGAVCGIFVSIRAIVEGIQTLNKLKKSDDNNMT